jgi:hypothetical protein
MLIRVLTWLLVRANAKPPSGHPETFYSMKEQLLRRFGRMIGAEWQHIRKTCWSCEDGVLDDGHYCWKCGGTGIYQQTWVLLQRWELGGAIFHRPVYRTTLDPHEIVTIHGYITHPEYHADTEEALLWLALLFDRRLFRGLLRAGPLWSGPGAAPSRRSSEVASGSAPGGTDSGATWWTPSGHAGATSAGVTSSGPGANPGTAVRHARMSSRRSIWQTTSRSDCRRNLRDRCRGAQAAG